MLIFKPVCTPPSLSSALPAIPLPHSVTQAYHTRWLRPHFVQDKGAQGEGIHLIPSKDELGRRLSATNGTGVLQVRRAVPLQAGERTGAHGTGECAHRC
jgi:hypothetical protein